MGKLVKVKGHHNDCSLSVILPAHNEEVAIAGTVLDRPYVISRNQGGEVHDIHGTSEARYEANTTTSSSVNCPTAFFIGCASIPFRLPSLA